MSSMYRSSCWSSVRTGVAKSSANPNFIGMSRFRPRSSERHRERAGEWGNALESRHDFFVEEAHRLLGNASGLARPLAAEPHEQVVDAPVGELLDVVGHRV